MALKWKFTTKTGPSHKLYYYIIHRGDSVIFDGPADVLVNWDRSNDPIKIAGAVNGSLRSIRKDVVDKVATEVLGYTSLIDPMKHRGWCVAKTTQQAVHSGVFVKCPSKPNLREWLSHGQGEGSTGNPVLQRWVYQRIIDNRIYTDKPIHKQGMQLVRDYRVSVLFGEIPAIYVKDKALVNTFHPHVPDKEWYHMLNSPLDDFSKTELNKILKFSERMGIDFAEVDVLRDNGTGQIFIIDVNNIPAASLFKGLSTAAKHDAFQRHVNVMDSKISNFVRSWE